MFLRTIKARALKRRKGPLEADKSKGDFVLCLTGGSKRTKILQKSFRVTLLQAKEREDAKVLFKTRQGKDQLKEIKRRAKTFTPGEGEDGAAAAGGRPATNASGLTPEQVREATQFQLVFLLRIDRGTFLKFVCFYLISV